VEEGLPHLGGHEHAFRLRRGREQSKGEGRVGEEEGKKRGRTKDRGKSKEKEGTCGEYWRKS